MGVWPPKPPLATPLFQYICVHNQLIVKTERSTFSCHGLSKYSSRQLLTAAVGRALLVGQGSGMRNNISSPLWVVGVAPFSIERGFCYSVLTVLRAQTAFLSGWHQNWSDLQIEMTISQSASDTSSPRIRKSVTIVTESGRSVCLGCVVTMSAIIM